MAGKILIVDDVATNRIVLKVKLASAYYHTLQAATGTDALRIAREAQPDVILLDVNLPDIDGIEICRRLKADVATCLIPVVMVTSKCAQETRLAALRAGADDCFAKPVNEAVLLARLRSLLRARETEQELRLRDSTRQELGFAEAVAGFTAPATVALVAAETHTAMTWKRDLAAHMSHSLIVTTRDEALIDRPGQSVPDVFVIAADISQPGEGLRLMSELRSRQATRYAAICIALGSAGRDTAAMALDLGASDLIPSDATPEEMALRIRTQLARKRNADRLRASVQDGLRMAVTDPLTGLYNRRYALPHVARIAEQAQTDGRHFAVMVLDLDRFKAVNDTWGHAAGDAVLVEVAARLRSNLRAVDLVARIGGEEFLVALPDTSLPAARSTAERLRSVIEEKPVRLPNGDGEVEVTLSIGLAMGGGQTAGGFGVEEIVGDADKALLGSKSEGRNQVTVSQTAA